MCSAAITEEDLSVALATRPSEPEGPVAAPSHWRAPQCAGWQGSAGAMSRNLRLADSGSAGVLSMTMGVRPGDAASLLGALVSLPVALVAACERPAISIVITTRRMLLVADSESPSPS